ncbi:MAG: helix-turn-helix transcriptional regulator, partial [Candidatus Micrarchaeota archaeon]
LDDSGASDIMIEAAFSSSAGQVVLLNLTGHHDDVLVSDRSGLIIEHGLEYSGDNTLITAKVPVDYLSFDISSDSLTMKEGSDWTFDLGISASQDIDAFSASLSLPKGAVLRSTNGAVQSGSDSLLISWHAEDIPENSRARMKAGYTISALEEQPDYMVLLSGGLAILVVIGALLVFLSRKKAADVRPAQPAEPAPRPSLEENKVFLTLSATDKEIVREIASRGGKTTQSTLNLNTHIPKATLSRRLSSLENRGILRRSQKGTRNLVSLTDIMQE